MRRGEHRGNDRRGEEEIGEENRGQERKGEDKKRGDEKEEMDFWDNYLSYFYPPEKKAGDILVVTTEEIGNL